MSKQLTQPIHTVRNFLSPLYVGLYNRFKNEKLNQQYECEHILQQTLAFTHYFHPSKLNRLLHLLTVIPFFGGLWLMFGFLTRFTTGLELTLPLIYLWSVLYVIFSMGIDRIVPYFLAFICLAISLFVKSIVCLNGGNPNSQSFTVLYYAIGCLLIALIFQIFIGHILIDDRTPAFMLQEAFVITPIYMIMSCLLMDNPFVEYLPELKREIEINATRERFHKFARFK